MDNKNKLDELFEKIDLDNIDESLIEEIPQNEMESFEQVNSLQKTFAEAFKFKPFGFSDLAIKAFAFAHQIQNIKMLNTPENIIIGDLIYKFYEQLTDKYIIDRKKWNKLYELIYYFNRKNQIKETNFYDIQKIYSEFFDYYVLTILKNIYDGLNSDFKNQVNDIILNFVGSLKNASTFWDLKMKDVNDFTGKKAISQINNNFLNVFLTPDMINNLLTIVGKYQELDDKVFNNSLSSGILMEFAEFIEQIDIIELFKFDKTKEVFENMTTIKQRNKMLLMHEILVLFEHPLAISPIKEEEFFKTNENSSKQSLLQKQIRIAEQVLCIS